MKKVIRLTESELTNLIERTINEIREDNPYDQLEKFLKDRIDFEGYNMDVNPEDKFTQLYDVFLDEYGWAIKRYGQKKALIEWLQGLPSTIDIPYYYDDIRNLLYALGFDKAKKMDDETLSDFYYSIVAKTILENK